MMILTLGFKKSEKGNGIHMFFTFESKKNEKGNGIHDNLDLLSFRSESRWGGEGSAAIF